MRLYLSSYRMGRRSDVLRWAGSGEGRAHIVFNALDIYGENRTQSFGREEDDLRKLGYTSTELDLRGIHNNDLTEAIATADLVWVVGGNAFVLAAVAAGAGLGDALRSAWNRGSHLIYAGYSAGACLAGPDLSGIEIMDDPTEADYDGTPPTLGLIEQRIVPHWRSDHPESALAERAAEELARRGLDHLRLSDGDDHLVGL